MSVIKNILRPFYVPVSNLIYRRFLGPQRYKYLFSSIRQVKAVRIAEVGTWTGDRAVQMIAVARKVSPTETIEYYGFDLFEAMTDDVYKSEVSKRPPKQKEVEGRLSKTGARIHLYQGDTRVTLPSVVAGLPNMDFIYIDGGHHIDTIKSDWNAIRQLMHPGTIVIFDDYWRNRADAGCKLIIDSIDKNKYSVEILPVVDSFNSADFGRLDISFVKVTLR